MTDPEIANKTYIEPLTPEIVSQIILREKPNAILPTMGGQTALNLAVKLSESEFLKKNNFYQYYRYKCCFSSNLINI